MKVAVIGSRGLTVSDLGRYLPENTTEIVSGGAKGVDTSAREYALAHGIKQTEFLPEYTRFGRSAPLKRNITIIECLRSGMENHEVRNLSLTTAANSAWKSEFTL